MRDQVDPTTQQRLAALAEASLVLLEGLLPRHAIEHMVLQADPAARGDLSRLATKHDAVTILFAGELRRAAGPYAQPGIHAAQANKCR